MDYQDLEKLPAEIQDYIVSDELVKNNQLIFDKYFFNQDQRDFVLDMEGAIFLKQIDSIDLPARMEDIQRAKYLDLRAITLDIATMILWPLQEYLGDIDRLILRLGGKVPRLVHLQKAPLQNKQFPRVHTGGVRESMVEYDDFKNLRLTSSKIVDKDGRRIPGTVDNWIKDYIHLLGAGSHDSLQRSKYLSDSYNVRALGPNEVNTLRHFLLSYDDDAVVDFENDGDLLKVNLHKDEAGKKQNQSTDELAADLQQRFSRASSSLISDDIIMSEADNMAVRLGDVLWDALGNQDKEKAISCLRSMQQHSSIVAVLAPDIRFKNILKRFVEVKYGRDVEKTVTSITDIDLSLRIYLEMFLSEKLELSEEDACLMALYLGKLKQTIQPPVYLDESDGQLHWRELRVENGKLSWASSV